MSAESVTRAVLTQDGRVLIEQPDGSYRPARHRTDWNRVRAMTDAEVEAAAASDPMPCPSTRRSGRAPASSSPVRFARSTPVCIDEDVLTWFRAQGPGYQTRMNAALRAYVGAHKREGR
jgi:uncharacterized protein (DUF4415 family)